ncbi:glycosyltransferase family 4 protein, partial [candidate division WWE3 bacterium]|nr:glycosyltransferase family 4 protein [candidate division WWE3 bacterium]
TQLIYGGVDTSLFEVDPKMKLSRRIPKIDQQISDDSIIITYLGRLIWAKGLRELLHAYKETISQINAETMLVIAGAGELSNELKSQVQRLAISDSVIFTGNLEYEDAVHLFNISDIFVHPSFNEGLPRVVLESAAAGNAVIATDVGSTKEIINSQTGILIEPKNTQQITNSLIQLINQPELRKKLGKDAKLHVKRYFDWHVITQQFYDFLQE